MKVKGFLEQWFPVYLIALVILLLVGSFSMKACWDGYQVNEQRLLELCGTTVEEFFNPDLEPATCPEAGQAFAKVEVCYTNWPLVLITVGIFSLLFFIVSLVMYQSDDKAG